MASRSVEEFNDNNPSDWFLRLEASHAVLQASSGQGIDEKVFLLASMGSKASTLLADLLAPTSISDRTVTYALMKATLLAHFKSQRLEMAERARFYEACQENGETSAQFFSRLKHLSEHCNFGVMLDSMLRDRLVLGCRSSDARRKLLQLDPLTLQTVRDTLAISEAMSASISLLHQHSDVNKVSPKPLRKTPNFVASKRKCPNCGRPNCPGKSQCAAKGKTCDGCGKMNHFRSVCRSSKGVNAVHAQLHVQCFPTNSVQSRISLLLNHKPVTMELDTGASLSLISEKMWRDLGSPSLEPSSKIFTAYDGHKFRPLGELRCQLGFEGNTVEATLTVVHSFKSYGLLGRDLLDHFMKSEVLHKVDAVTELPAMKVKPVSISVTHPEFLSFAKARPVPLPMREAVSKHLDELVAKGVLSPVDSSPCASPVVWVKKRNGDLRLCADFKGHVNKAIASDSYPIPAMETIFANLSDAKVFAKLDLREAYWQIKIDKKARELCTINTHKGLFQFNRLPKGMKNSSAVFQRVMEQVLDGIEGLIIYQDDILLHAKSSSQLASRVASVLQRLEQKAVTINSDKSVLNVERVKFLGHILTPSGIFPDPDIVNKITSLPPPKNKRELESFLGLINFFGRMVPDFAKLTLPLHSLRKKETPFVWTDEHNKCFEELLKNMSKPPVLQSYDLRKPVTLTTDASETTIGGVLTQPSGNLGSEPKPVIFVSRALTKAELRYSNIEKEALAVVWCCMRLRQLLLGRKFTLVTDHRPLLKIYDGPRLPKVASSRLTRWSSLLQQFDCEFQYSPGESIPHADSLTRLPFLSDYSEPEDLVINDVELSVSEEMFDSIAKCTATDRTASCIIARIQNDDWSNLKPEERPFFRLRAQLNEKDGVLCMANRCYLPQQLRRDAFSIAHQMHSGTQSTLNRLKLSAWWPSIRKDTATWVTQCSVCQKVRPRFTKSQSSWPKGEVFERIHADWFFVRGIGNLLLIVDSASGWIEVFQFRERTTENVVRALTDVFCRFGIPKVLVTDNAAEFTSASVNDFCKINGIMKMESPPHHQQSNGSAERGVQTIKALIKAWREQTAHMDFPSYLQRILLHYRACYQRRDGRSPAEAVYGREMRVPLTKQFLLGDPILYKQGEGQLSNGRFIMERGSNTAWILDTSEQLRLAHEDQLAPVSSPSPVSSPLQNSFQDGPTELPPAEEPEPNGPNPRWPRRNRKPRSPTDYDDL
jgi:transposase InsO family protein